MLMLNVGCGPDYREGYVNIDACGIFRRDVAMTLPGDSLEGQFGKGSVDGILFRDVMEHFFRWEGLAIIRDFFAVLRLGGELDIVTPDLGRIVTDKGITLQRKMELIHGYQGQPMDVPSQPPELAKAWMEHPEWFTHKYTWTEGELRDVLASEGFEVRKVEWLTYNEMEMKAVKD